MNENEGKQAAKNDLFDRVAKIVEEEDAKKSNSSQ